MGGTIGYYKTEYLANDNFAHYSVYDFNYGGWITNCQYYYEVDKDTNIIVGYKITDQTLIKTVECYQDIKRIKKPIIEITDVLKSY